MNSQEKNWFKQHADTIAILGTFAFCFWNLNEKISIIDNRLTVIETVMKVKNIIPNDICKHEEKK